MSTIGFIGTGIMGRHMAKHLQDGGHHLLFCPHRNPTPDELLAAGVTVDSSIYPVVHPDYGVPGAPGTPYRIETEHGELLEFPPLSWDVLGKRLPVGGGGYLRSLRRSACRPHHSDSCPRRSAWCF